MYIDTSVRSRGHFTVMATTMGSYGELAHRQFGPAYKTIDAALKKARLLHAKGMRMVELRNLNTNERHYIT